MSNVRYRLLPDLRSHQTYQENTIARHRHRHRERRNIVFGQLCDLRHQRRGGGGSVQCGVDKRRRRGREIGRGGLIQNGFGGYNAALIAGAAAGVQVSGKPGTVLNSATIIGTGTAGIGVALNAGGDVVNGSGNTAALISGGADGISTGGRATITNYGTILGTTAAGVVMAGAGLLANDGSIASVVGIGVSRSGSAAISNGSSNFTAASISGGYEGVRLMPSGVAGKGGKSGAPRTATTNNLVNWGTISGGSNGVDIFGGGTITNGAAGDVGAGVMGGIDGILINGAGAVVNYGSIVGTAPVVSGLVFPPKGFPIPPHAPWGGYGINF